jgi:hypothetical protein
VAREWREFTRLRARRARAAYGSRKQLRRS